VQPILVDGSGASLELAPLLLFLGILPVWSKNSKPAVLEDFPPRASALLSLLSLSFSEPQYTRSRGMLS